jgi:hypothetical protein
MENKKKESFDIKAIRVSLCLKVIIIGWAFIAALQSDEFSLSMFYLVLAIIFAGLFIFQLSFYRKKKRPVGNDEA